MTFPDCDTVVKAPPEISTSPDTKAPPVVAFSLVIVSVSVKLDEIVMESVDLVRVTLDPATNLTSSVPDPEPAAVNLTMNSSELSPSTAEIE